ncbi:MAG: winged helix DNA-binding protein [Spirochaetales bacterium]|nr:winged helix DNA-binding protein [Spirochaetales bacterium]
MERLIDNILELKQKCNFESEISSSLPLTGREISVLCAIHADEQVRSHELAERLDLSDSRASRLIKSLTEKNLLVWKMDNEDRRAAQISLSDEGKEICKQIEDRKCDCEDRILGKLNEEEIAAVKKGLSILMEVLS